MTFSPKKNEKGENKGLIFDIIESYYRKDYPQLKRFAHSLKGRALYKLEITIFIEEKKRKYEIFFFI